jgi:hypothetical protein
MIKGALQSEINATAQGMAIARAVNESRFAFSFFIFSAANGAGGAMV